MAIYWPHKSRNDAVEILGGTANLAVLGGNLPPNLASRMSEPFGAVSRHKAGGQVARATRDFNCIVRVN